LVFLQETEIAFVSVGKLSIELRKVRQLAEKLGLLSWEKPARFIGTTLNCIKYFTRNMYGLLWSNILDSFWEYLGYK